MDIKRLHIVTPNAFAISGFYSKYIIACLQITVSDTSLVLYECPILIKTIELICILHILWSAVFESTVFDGED